MKIKYLIIPDVHGRIFWKEPVNKILTETETNIIFLGDYLDPYAYEWDDGEDENRIAIDRFKEIIQLKKDNSDRITLLLGNHDGGYAISTDICTTRRDYMNAGEIERLFRDNHDLFQIAEETTLNGKHFIFSHAGIFKGWCRRAFGELADSKDFNPVNALNNAWLVGDETIKMKLGIYDNFRGYGGAIYGSPIWADIRAWPRIKQEETYGFNIVGHTQLEEKPVVLDTIIDLDCRKAFYLDEEGDLYDYNTNKKI